jgi:serine/threonine-protein phosphatase 2A regulatory subunit B
MTGSYNNTFHLYDREGKSDITLQADKSAFKAKRLGSSKNKMAMTRGSGKGGVVGSDPTDFNKKILHSSWHPQENTIAVAATNNLFIFT